jgi:hypothetical protein
MPASSDASTRSRKSCEYAFPRRHSIPSLRSNSRRPWNHTSQAFPKARFQSARGCSRSTVTASCHCCGRLRRSFGRRKRIGCSPAWRRARSRAIRSAPVSPMSADLPSDDDAQWCVGRGPWQERDNSACRGGMHQRIGLQSVPTLILRHYRRGRAGGEDDELPCLIAWACAAYDQSRTE